MLKLWQFNFFNFNNLGLGLIIILLLSSCATRSNMLYFQDAVPKLEADEVPDEVIEERRELITIRPYDILQVTVQTVDDEIRDAFREGVHSRAQRSGELGAFYYQGYMVDDNGEVDFPLIGRVRLQGLTIREAKDMLEELVRQYAPRAHVEVKFLTFKVYMFGEVNNPGLITVPNEQSTLLEALSLAGDLTDFANRNKIKVLRGDINDPDVYEVDLTKVSSFASPGFELKPYDIIYVEPANRKFLSLISRDFSVVLTFVNSAFILVNLYNLISD